MIHLIKFEIICIWITLLLVKSKNKIAIVEALRIDRVNEITETIPVFSYQAENSEMVCVVMSLPESKCRMECIFTFNKGT